MDLQEIYKCVVARAWTYRATWVKKDNERGNGPGVGGGGFTVSDFDEIIFLSRHFVVIGEKTCFHSWVLRMIFARLCSWGKGTSPICHLY